MNILILGNASDPHAAHLKDVLSQAGATVDYWDTCLFPTQLRISWQPDQQIGYLTLPGGRQLNLQDIHSVFWRNFSGVHVPPLKDSEQQWVAFNDSMSTLRSLIRACPARWINSWQAYQFHKEKPLQLGKVKQIGVPIPATLIGNNPDQVREFVQVHDKVVFKPVYGGAHTQFVTEHHLEPQRLSRVLTVELPDLVEQQCFAIAKALMLEWTAIDWRLQPTGEYIFLEANPSPMFLYFERQTGFPLTQQLVNLLMN